MSRTYVHKPISSFFDWATDTWRDQYSKYSNTRNKIIKRWSRKEIRHAPIDEDETKLINAEAERGRNTPIARDWTW
jgi:hypothetical protein